MAALTLRASGSRSAEEVWQLYADPQRWRQWSPQIRRVDAVGLLRPGLEGTVTTYLPVAVHFRVVEVHAADRTWSWDVRLGPIRIGLDHGVRADPTAGSSTWLRLRGPFPVIMAYAPLAQLALRRLVG